MKLLKQELDMMAKNSKKEEIRKRKEQKEIQLAEEVGITEYSCYSLCQAHLTLSGPSLQ